MRILHVENIAGVATTLSRAQRESGICSDVLITWPNEFGFDVDHQFIYRGSGVYLPLNLAKVINLVRGYDVLHIHGGLTWNRLDLVLSKLTSKQAFLGHFHGSDIRMGYGLRYQRLFDEGVVATPDLLKWCPNYKYIPNPVKVPGIVVSMPYISPLKILHMPTNRRTKGTDIIEKAIHLLKGNRFDIRFKIVEGASHAKAMEEINEAHIIIDQISQEELTGIKGMYGKVSLEAMARGRVAVSYIDPSLRGYYPSELPIISPELPSPESLSKCLDGLLTEKDSLASIGMRGRAYVISHHDPKSIGDVFIGRYTRMLERK